MMSKSPKWQMLLALALMAPLLGGCPKKATNQDAAYDGADGANGGLGEGGLGGSAGSSLNRSGKGQRPEEDGILKDVHFGYDSDELDAEAQSVVARNAGWLREHTDAKVELEGHCDNRGTPEYNLALGARRASAVKQGLIANGVSNGRVSTISYGEELPLCQEDTDDCWARNRRVHGVVIGK